MQGDEWKPSRTKDKVARVPGRKKGGISRGNAVRGSSCKNGGVKRGSSARKDSCWKEHPRKKGRSVPTRSGGCFETDFAMGGTLWPKRDTYAYGPWRRGGKNVIGWDLGNVVHSLRREKKFRGGREGEYWDCRPLKGRLPPGKV